MTADFEERVLRGDVHYKLQIQLHEIKPDDSHLILHSARAWDKATHPWLDLADVKLTSTMPRDVVRDTRYSMYNCPMSVAVPGPVWSIYDYNSIAYLRSRVYPGSKAMSSIYPASETSAEDLVTYCISVCTGRRKGSGTDAKVSLTVTGRTFTIRRYHQGCFTEPIFIKGSQERKKNISLGPGSLVVPG